MQKNLYNVQINHRCSINYLTKIYKGVIKTHIFILQSMKLNRNVVIKVSVIFVLS